jgi:erythromycin esterase
MGAKSHRGRIVLVRIAALALLVALFLVTLVERKRPAPDSEPFIEWARSRAIPIKTAEAGKGFDDLAPFKKIIGDARLVGVGEATHGTREFFQFKHRMFEFLVMEMGFTAFGIEASFPDAEKVNDYVQGKDGDARKVVAGMRFWTWNTEEVVALVEWMREHNKTAKRNVRFYGFDMQFHLPAVKEALDYVKRFDDKAAEAVEWIPKLGWELSKDKPENQNDWSRAEVSLRELKKFLEKNREGLVSKSSIAEWNVAHRNTMVALQAIHQLAEKKDIGYRDLAMAENVRWMMEQEGTKGRIMLWAHNGHINTRREKFGPISVGEQDWNPMGWKLRQDFGKDYVAIGLAFSEGSFRANPLRKTHQVGPARPESFDGVMARIGPDILAINWDERSEDAAVEQWIEASHLMRAVGSTYTPELRELMFDQIKVRKLYNATVFFRKTSAARPSSVKTVREHVE